MEKCSEYFKLFFFCIDKKDYPDCYQCKVQNLVQYSYLHFTRRFLLTRVVKSLHCTHSARSYSCGHDHFIFSLGSTSVQKHALHSRFNILHPLNNKCRAHNRRTDCACVSMQTFCLASCVCSSVTCKKSWVRVNTDQRLCDY